MQKLMKALHKNEKGFTLVELMVVVVIIGILVAIAIPIYGAITERAERSTITANVRIIDGAIGMGRADGMSDTELSNIAWADLFNDSDAANPGLGEFIEPIEPVGQEQYATDDQARAIVNNLDGEGGLTGTSYTLVELLQFDS